MARASQPSTSGGRRYVAFAARTGRMRRRGGITVVYTIIAMAAILGLCSLGMDYGRVQLAKYELRRAVDAAARAGALNLRQGGDATTARAAAVAVAAENTVDGNVLTLTASHVLVGNWNSTTKSFTDGGTPTNAVRVTVTLGKATNNGIPLTFARVLGMASCDVSAGATALGSLATSAGFVGLDGVEVGNNVEFAGYDSSAGEPGGPNVSNNGHVASNAGVTIGMNGTVRGDVVLGPGGDLTTGGNFYTTGSTQNQPNAMTATATEAPTVTTMGDVTIGNNDDYALPAGTYRVNNLTVGQNSTVTFTGPVTIYVTGNVTVGNGFTMNAYQNIPANLDLRMYGTGKTFSAGNDLTITGEVYGPGYALDAQNNLSLRGSAVFKTITAQNNATFYYDTDLPAPLGGTAGSTATAAVTTVQ